MLPGTEAHRLFELGFDRKSTIGATTDVFFSRNGSEVAKVSSMRANLEYARFCRENPGANFPRISDIHEVRDRHGFPDGRTTVVCERLDEVPPTETEALGEWLARLGSALQGAEPVAQVPDYKNLKAAVETLWNEAILRGLSWDLGGPNSDSKAKNVMVRPGTGDYVVIDPWISDDPQHSAYA